MKRKEEQMGEERRQYINGGKREEKGGEVKKS